MQFVKVVDGQFEFTPAVLLYPVIAGAVAAVVVAAVLFVLWHFWDAILARFFPWFRVVRYGYKGYEFLTAKRGD